MSEAARFASRSRSFRASRTSGGEPRPLEEEPELHERRGQDVVEVVRDPAGQLPDRLHLLGVLEPLLELPLAGNVPDDRQEAGLTGDFHGPGDDDACELGAVLPAEPAFDAADPASPDRGGDEPVAGGPVDPDVDAAGAPGPALDLLSGVAEGSGEARVDLDVGAGGQPDDDDRIGLGVEGLRKLLLGGAQGALARDELPGPLGDTPLEPLVLPAQDRGPPPVDRSGEARRPDDRERVEPPGLVEPRALDERDGVAGPVPDAVVVGGRDLETVTARLEVGVDGRPEVAGLGPARFVALEPVAEEDGVGPDEAESRVVDRQSAGPGRSSTCPVSGSGTPSTATRSIRTGGTTELKAIRSGWTTTIPVWVVNPIEPSGPPNVLGWDP